MDYAYLAVMVLLVLLVTGGALAAPPVPPTLPEMPLADTGIGFFFDPFLKGQGVKFPNDKERYFKHMAEVMGVNTTTIYYRNPEELASTIDAAVRAGLGKFPLYLLVNGHGKDGAMADYKAALLLGKEIWPPLIMYIANEIGESAEFDKEKTTKYYRDMAREWRPLPVGGCANGPGALAFADIFHHILVTTAWYTDSLVEAYRERYGVVGTYRVGSAWRGYDMHRYVSGLWRWKTKTPLHLWWSYSACIREDDEGNITLTDMGRAVRDGAYDYRLLRATEEAIYTPDSAYNPAVNGAMLWMQRLKDGVPTDPDFNITNRPPHYKDSTMYIDSAPPFSSWEPLRQWCGSWLHEFTGAEQIW